MKMLLAGLDIQQHIVRKQGPTASVVWRVDASDRYFVTIKQLVRFVLIALALFFIASPAVLASPNTSPARRTLNLMQSVNRRAVRKAEHHHSEKQQSALLASARFGDIMQIVE